ncbi:sensor histidine kinase [Enterococcus olivae]
MFYLLVLSNIIYLLVSFIILDGIPVLKKTNPFLLSVMVFLLLSYIRLGFYISVIDELLLFMILLTFSYMNNRKQLIGTTFLLLSLAFILQFLAIHVPYSDRLLLYLMSSGNDLWIFSYILLMLVIVGLVSFLAKKYLLSKLSQKVSQFLGYGAFASILCYQLYSFFEYILLSPTETQGTTFVQVFILLFLFMITISIISIYTLVNNQRLGFEAQKKTIEQQAMKVYIDELNKQSLEIRKFRHDYINILSSLEGYLEMEDFDGLKAYYHQSIQPTRTLFSDHFLRLNDLQKIDDPALRSIFVTKLLLAQEKGLSVQLEISDTFSLPPQLDPVVLVRIIGILLDNAIEELEQLQHGQLEVALLKIETDILLLIQNTVRPTIEPLHQLKSAGFSTKGTSRGLGLSTVDELISQSSSLLLETKITPQHFTQKITILGG